MLDHRNKNVWRLSFSMELVFDFRHPLSISAAIASPSLIDSIYETLQGLQVTCLHLSVEIP